MEPKQSALTTWLSKRTNQYIVLGGIVIILLVVIIGVVAALALGSHDDTKTSGASSSDSNLSKGTVSGLSGTTSSYSNLKGLTVRINQIDTCNPKQLSAYVAVASESGDVNKSFGKKDVKIYLDGTQVTDFDFDPVNTSKLPLANMLLIDRSGSMAGTPIDSAKAAATGYVDKLKSADQVGVIQFDDQVNVLTGMTTDKAAAKSAIATITARGDTATYDALQTAIDNVPDCGRKAVTILTDGDDNRSRSSTEASVIASANKKNLPIFSVGIKGSTFNPASIQSISEKTGAMYIQADTPQDIAGIYDKIDAQLTGQFAANLKLSLKKDGSTHTLKIVSTVEGSDTSSERSFTY